MLKRIALGFALLLAGLIVVLAANTLRQGSRQIEVAPVAPLAVDESAAAQRLAAAVRLRTLSFDGRDGASAGEFRKLHGLLEKSFPRAHAVIKREFVNELSLLYTWPGSDPKARPIMLMAHQDVVPVAPGTEKDWQVEPFSGEIRDGFVWAAAPGTTRPTCSPSSRRSRRLPPRASGRARRSISHPATMRRSAASRAPSPSLRCCSRAASASISSSTRAC